MGRFLENSNIFWFISGVASDFRRFRSGSVVFLALECRMQFFLEDSSILSQMWRIGRIL